MKDVPETLEECVYCGEADREIIAGLCFDCESEDLFEDYSVATSA